jgi:hypothetical protein
MMKATRKGRVQPGRFDRMRGSATSGLSTDEIMTLTRGEARPLVPNEKTVKAIEAARRGELKALLLADQPKLEFPLPTRGRRRRRAPKPLA